ncbi:MAG: flavin reductase [Blastocatellia bacterium]|nr:flavin reductase [Blastocatellia bacterium]
MSVTKEQFKQTMSNWASGITIITTCREEGLLAMTASSFTSLSIEPPFNTSSSK